MYNTNSFYPSSQQMRQPNYLPQLKGRPVSSIDEARAIPIDFDGSIFFFPDVANKRIYTKQINLDGTATLNMYELKEIPMPTASNNNYVTREEFEEVINKLQQSLAPQGRSPMRRKMYMESHELHKDKNTQMRELESYVQELTSDIMEMIAQATPEEKQMLQQKIMILANKIQ